MSPQIAPSFADGTLRTAQAAIALPEVQDMIRRLSEHGLGVSIPHMHVNDGEFAALPADMVQVEREGQQVTFEPLSVSKAQRMNPVAWRWLPGQDGGRVEVCAGCYYRNCDDTGRKI